MRAVVPFALAGRLGGIPTADGNIATTKGLVYCSVFGAVRLHPFGGVVVTLGNWQDDTEELASAFEAATAC